MLDIPVPLLLLLPLVLLHAQKHERFEKERHKLHMNDLNDAAAGQDAAVHEQAAAARPPMHKRNFKSQHVSNRSTIYSSSASASAPVSAAAGAFISSKNVSLLMFTESTAEAADRWPQQEEKKNGDPQQQQQRLWLHTN